MRALADDYLNQLQQLLPPGQAWTREAGAVLTEVLAGAASELARAHNRLVDLVDEADPQTTTELLVDWERVVGLPDCCLGIAQSVEARRAAVVARLAARGGQSAAYYEALCGAYGWPIKVTDYRIFRAGHNHVGDPLCTALGEMFRAGVSVAGDRLASTNWTHRWRVDGEPTEVGSFQVGRSVAGEALRVRDNRAVRCLIEARKPAHTIVTYAFPLPHSDPLDEPVTTEEFGELRAGDPVGLALAWHRFTTWRAGAAPVVAYAPFDGGYGRHSAAARIVLHIAIAPDPADEASVTASIPWDDGATRWDQGLTAWSLA